ncbi:response regulator [Tianweitania sediminis]|jgi:two-component system chemotaxis response regulator CheY|uniref:Response regulator n=1 Tax=Tianweitania sediminis TaxID=1502156 RepID=A0A8J7UHP3_9HYPH|nr:response regulator [Tianweitania sediminis]MBP0439414.1 response regulator [Tianweitania sediminis]
MKRCLIVEDSSVIRKVAKRILTSNEMLVVEAADGVGGLAICEAEMPDVILVDSVLPDMAAVDFIRRVGQIRADMRPHIMLCLTEMDVGAIMRAKRAGAHSYLLKPFNRSQLLERFRQVSATSRPAASAAA